MPPEPAERSKVIYTFGQTDLADPAVLVRLADRLGAVVVDVRGAWAMRRGRWSEKALVERLGCAYTREPALANTHSPAAGTGRPGGARRGLDAVLHHATARHVLLLCVSATAHGCGRSRIARQLARRGAEVVHVRIGEAPAERRE